MGEIMFRFKQNLLICLLNIVLLKTTKTKTHMWCPKSARMAASNQGTINSYTGNQESSPQTWKILLGFRNICVKL